MINTHEHICRRTCSRSVTISYDENHVIQDVKFLGGCHGNTQGVAKLCIGRTLEDVHDTLIGIDCNRRGTSCPNELALGIEEILKTYK